MNELEILKKAYSKETITTEIDFGNNIVGTLSLSDMNEITREQGRIQDQKYDEYCEKGLKDKPINEKRWQKYLDSVSKKNQEMIKKDKPVNLAEQYAEEDTRIIIITELVPKYLRKPTGEFLFPDTEKQIGFGQLLLNTPSLSRLVQDKIIAMMSRVKDMRDTVKN